MDENKESTLTTLFKTYSELENPPIIELQDISHKPVAALYLDKLKFRQFAVSETNNSEKYCIYIDGVLVYFSFFRKFNQ